MVDLARVAATKLFNRLATRVARQSQNLKNLMHHAAESEVAYNTSAEAGRGAAMPPGLMPASSVAARYLESSAINRESLDMASTMVIIADEIANASPGLADLYAKIEEKLDEINDRIEKSMDGGDDSEAKIDDKDVLRMFADLIASEEFNMLENFELYSFMYAYHANYKRKRRKKTALSDAIEAYLEEIEETHSLDLAEGLQKYQNKAMEQMSFLQQFKKITNSYHSDYSEIIDVIDKDHKGNYKSALKATMKLHAVNIANARKTDFRSYEQKAFLAENMQFETKILNLMTLLARLEPASKRLTPKVPTLNETGLCRGFIDLLDGFDCARLIASYFKRLDAADKKKLSFVVVNSCVSIMRQLPDKFFKTDHDRANLVKRLADFTQQQAGIRKHHEYF